MVSPGVGPWRGHRTDLVAFRAIGVSDRDVAAVTEPGGGGGFPVGAG